MNNSKMERFTGSYNCHDDYDDCDDLAGDILRGVILGDPAKAVPKDWARLEPFTEEEFLPYHNKVMTLLHSLVEEGPTGDGLDDVKFIGAYRRWAFILTSLRVPVHFAEEFIEENLDPDLAEHTMRLLGFLAASKTMPKQWRDWWFRMQPEGDLDEQVEGFINFFAPHCRALSQVLSGWTTGVAVNQEGWAEALSEYNNSVVKSRRVGSILMRLQRKGRIRLTSQHSYVKHVSACYEPA